MELKIINLENKETGKIKLPAQFNEPVREDLIRRAVVTLQSNRRQRYGASPEAGKRASAVLSKRRRDYRGCYGHGISRTPRKILSRRGTQMYWVGAFSPNTVGGRRAHPPKAEKIWEKKINKKENRKAIRSAMAASLIKERVEKRGHKVPKNYPFIIETNIENMGKTKDAKRAMETIGLKEELKRAMEIRVRAGKGKLRGRKYKKKTGPLIIVSKNCKLLDSAKNIPGVDVVEVNALNAELLAPGTHIGRLTLWTKSALERLENEKLFTDSPVKKEEKK